MTSRPQVGVAAIIHNGKGKIVMGQRKGSHGADTYAFPGGHLELNETFSSCAKREVLEETGLEVSETRVLAVTNDVMEKEGRHYVTVFMVAGVVGEAKDPVAMEPEKCAKWEWVEWTEMWGLAKGQAEAEDGGREVGRTPLFLPIVNLWRQYPELDPGL